MRVIKHPIFVASLSALALAIAATSAQAANHSLYGDKSNYAPNYTDQRAADHYNNLPVKAKKHDNFQVFAYGVTVTNPGDQFNSSADNGYWAGLALPVFSGGNGREKVHVELGYMAISKAPVKVTSTVQTGSWEDGWLAGNTAGHNSGYGAGHDTGYGAGHDTGYGAGHDTGYGAGHNAGYGTGHNAGYGTGHNAGYGTGHNAGYGAGYGAGWTDGDAGNPNNPSYPSGVTPPVVTAPTVTAPGVTAPTVTPPIATLPTGMVIPNAPSVTPPDAPVLVVDEPPKDIERNALTAAVSYSYELDTNTRLKTRLRTQVGVARLSGIKDEVSMFAGVGMELGYDRYALRLGYDRYIKSENIDAVANLGLSVNF